MSSVQLNFYSNADVSIIDLMNTEDANFIGKHQVSLTNYDNTSLPAIAAGSIVENNGGLFKFTSESAITGSPSDGTVYIRLIPSGDPALGTAIVTPEFSNTSPTWSDSKQGWYGTSGSANYRYLEYVMTKATAAYSNKKKFNNESLELRNKGIPFIGCDVLGFPLFIKTITGTLDGSGSGVFAHGISSARTDQKILFLSVFVANSGPNSVPTDLAYDFSDTNINMNSLSYANQSAKINIIYK